MCAVDGSGGSTASRRSAATSFCGSCWASLRSGLRRERGRADAEVQVAPLVESAAQPVRGLFRATVLGEAPRELFGRLFRLELRELGLLLREHRARLQLEERGDQDQELAAGVQVELALLGEMLDERDHDLGEIDLLQRQLLAQDEREQQVERPLERVEVELQFADGYGHLARLAALPDAALRDRHRRALSACRARGSRTPRPGARRWCQMK